MGPRSNSLEFARVSRGAAASAPRHRESQHTASDSTSEAFSFLAHANCPKSDIACPFLKFIPNRIGHAPNFRAISKADVRTPLSPQWPHAVATIVRRSACGWAQRAAQSAGDDEFDASTHLAILSARHAPCTISPASRSSQDRSQCQARRMKAYKP